MSNSTSVFAEISDGQWVPNAESENDEGLPLAFQSSPSQTPKQSDVADREQKKTTQADASH
jgi:hypothetical protein